MNKEGRETLSVDLVNELSKKRFKRGKFYYICIKKSYDKRLKWKL